MKISSFTLSTTLTIGAISLLQHASAYPIDRREVSLPVNLAQINDDVTVVDEFFEEVLLTEEVVVFVDQSGTPISTLSLPTVATTIWSSSPIATITHTQSHTTTTSSATPTTSSSTSSTTSSTTSATSSSSSTSKADPATVVPPVKSTSTQEHALSGSTPTSKPVVAPPVTSKPIVHSTTTKPSIKASAPATPNAPKAEGYGFSYSPYMAHGQCKSAQQVANDFGAIPDIAQYSVVRIYGTDCNQVSTVLAAAKAHGLKLFAGVFDLGTVNSEIATIVAAAQGDWSYFDTISVGNELVNDALASPSSVIAAVGSARSQLRAAGYNGPVVTVDTLVASRANPSLCDASDYCAVNCHPFFDGGVAASGSGGFLTTQIGTLRDVLSDKNQRIVISETGWPWQGATNGNAVPSAANQQAALSSIKTTFATHPKDVFLFTAYNDMWKKSSKSTFYADQFWGFLGYAPSG